MHDECDMLCVISVISLGVHTCMMSVMCDKCNKLGVHTCMMSVICCV